MKHELSALEKSGPASSTLTSNALNHVEALKRLPALVGADFNDFSCFANGCAVTVTSKDAAAADAAGSAIIRSEDFLLWKGPKLRSGPMRSPSGQVQTIVILYREPDRKSSTPNQSQ
ncbi:MAG TPA: hypothetical protein VIF57_03840 [Polyangia bacterium]|jgi:hypothetical protein